MGVFGPIVQGQLVYARLAEVVLERKEQLALGKCGHDASNRSSTYHHRLNGGLLFHLSLYLSSRWARRARFQPGVVPHVCG